MKNTKKMAFWGMFSMVLLVSLGLVYAYTDGQTIGQGAIDNFDTDITFSQLYSDLECSIIQNANRTIDSAGDVNYVYQINCWDIVIEDDEYTIRSRDHYVTLSLDSWKSRLTQECGGSPSGECRQQFIDYTKSKVKAKFKRNIMDFLGKIDSWKTQDEPEGLGISF